MATRDVSCYQVTTAARHRPNKSREEINLLRELLLDPPKRSPRDAAGRVAYFRVDSQSLDRVSSNASASNVTANL